MRLFACMVLVFGISVSYGQTSVRTEYASTRYHHSAAATTGDTLTTTNAVSATRFLNTVTVNTSVASDTIILKNGTGTVAQIILGASPPGYPFTVVYGVRCDTSLILVKKKASDITIGWRGGL